MIKFAYITRAIKSFLVEIKSIGGTTQNRFISPKGLFSKPKKENAIVINLSNGNNQDVVLALQKDVELQDGDVYVTDDKSYIHFHFKDGTIEVNTSELVFNMDKFTVNAQETIFNGGSITHNGTSIDDTHTHSQDADSALNTQAETNAPS